MTWPNPRTDPTRVYTSADFIIAAKEEQEARQNDPAGPHEINAGAHLEMHAQIALSEGRQLDPRIVLDEARHFTLQLALLNHGLNPGSAFLTAAIHAGWHLKGSTFYREVRHA